MVKLLVVKSKLHATPVGGILPFFSISFQESLPGTSGIVLAQAGERHIANSIILVIKHTRKDLDCSIGIHGHS